MWVLSEVREKVCDFQKLPLDKSHFITEVPDMADKKIMTPEEKALLQARHRQEGAILESIVPHIKEMDLDSLKRELMIRLRGM